MLSVITYCCLVLAEDGKGNKAVIFPIPPQPVNVQMHPPMIPMNRVSVPYHQGQNGTVTVFNTPPPPVVKPQVGDENFRKWDHIKRLCPPSSICTAE